MPSGLEDALRQWNEQEHRFLTLLAEADRAAELTSEEERLNLAAKLETFRRKVRESKGRVAAVLAEFDG